MLWWVHIQNSELSLGETTSPPPPGNGPFQSLYLYVYLSQYTRGISDLSYMAVSNLPLQISIWSCSKTKIQIDRLSNTSQISILRFIESNIECQTPPYYRPSLQMYFYIFRSYLSAFYTYIYICIWCVQLIWHEIQHIIELVYIVEHNALHHRNRRIVQLFALLYTPTSQNR